MTQLSPEDLARAVAAEFGPNATVETEAELGREKTRAWGQFAIDAATVGAFIAQVAQVALTLHLMRKTRGELVSELEAKASTATKIDEGTRRSIIGRIADRLTGGGST